jgi:hypothetical protein
MRIAEAAPGTLEDVRRPGAGRLHRGHDRGKQGAQAFLCEHLYQHYQVLRMTNQGAARDHDLFGAFVEDPRLLPPQYQTDGSRGNKPRATADYIAGMTDRYSMREHRACLPSARYDRRKHPLRDKSVAALQRIEEALFWRYISRVRDAGGRIQGRGAPHPGFFAGRSLPDPAWAIAGRISEERQRWSSPSARVSTTRQTNMTPAASASSPTSRTRRAMPSSSRACKILRTSNIAAPPATIPLLGDGAGILIQIPDQFLREEMARQGVALPPVGMYGVGMVFLPRQRCQPAFLRSR